jgi:hypothetical protein
LKNLIWLVPDGVRSVPYNDPYGRFDFFNELEREGFIEFENTYTANPSTYMSFSSFLRGIYSTKMAERYGELKSLQYEFDTIDTQLHKQGYNNYFLTFYPQDLKQQVHNNIEELVKNKDKLIEALYNNEHGYTEKYGEYIKYFLENEELKEPFFLLIHVNVPDFQELNKKYDNYKHEDFLQYDFNGNFKEIYGLLQTKIK